MSNDINPVLPPQQEDGEYAPAGEADGTSTTFTASRVAGAFGVEEDRVLRAMAGEFGPDVTEVSSQQAQHLAEELLVDQPLAERQAALMRLGAFTPRADHMSGLGEKSPDEESDRPVRNSDQADGERGSA